MVDIGSSAFYPEGELSNFTPRQFIFDGVECGSLEGVIQAFKFNDENSRVFTCKMSGTTAKFRGKPKKWWIKQTLYWKDIEYKRDSEEYQELLDRLFQSVYDQCKRFRDALKATKTEEIVHTMSDGKDIHHTVLTSEEFCSRLTKLRDGGILYVKNI